MTRPSITYVIAYDIANPRRLVRVHRFLREHAFPVQYSVFLATLDTRALKRLLSGLSQLIQPRADDVRAYPLPTAPEIESVGRGNGIAGVLPVAGQVVGLGRPIP